MLARVPWTPTPETNRRREVSKPKRINKDRKKHLVETVAAIMREGREQGAPSHFTHEASCRHGLRSGLCLDGWGWHEADAVAAEIVKTALNKIGAQRPTWAEGQPEWTQPGILALARSHCIRCGTKLPEGHFKFCDHLCHAAFHVHKNREADREAYNVKQRAYYAAWSAKQPEQPCEQCGRPFRPNRPGRRFCSKACSNRNNAGLRCRAVG